MAGSEEVQLSLKLLMIKESNKFLYAEVDSDFADVLLSFLTLPLGTIVRLLIKHYGNNAPIIGSLNSLYSGLQNLDSSHFWSETGKLMLLNPRNSSGSECSRLKLKIDDTPPIQYFTCPNHKCASLYYQMRCGCSSSGTRDITRKVLNMSPQSGDKSVFTAQTSFILTDDLQILSNSLASVFQILKLNGIEDTNVLEERTLAVGLKEIMELLKASLVSQTPMTYIIFYTNPVAATVNNRKNVLFAKYEPDALPQTQTSKNNSPTLKRIAVKVLVQKSTNRVLLAETRQDFIDCLFSFLTIPFGRVQLLLGNNTCLGSISNLYRSISNSETVHSEAITRLLEPQLPPYYLSLYQILSLDQQSSPALYWFYDRCKDKTVVSTNKFYDHYEINMIDPKGKDSFVKGPTLFIVTDDLEVSTSASTSIISTLNQMKVPISDIEEQELDIGIEEALSILKASLTSTSALTNGFKPFLKRQPKQEK